MITRLKQKQEDKKSAEIEGHIVDKKINELCSSIRESRSKLDDYVSSIGLHVSQVVNHRLNKFVALHSEIVEEKDHEIKVLQEHNEQTRLSQMGENIQKLMKTINNYELEIERLNTIKEMFRKESERFKIELDIREKELDASKRREKQLMKKIWILEEDIKDIYSSEPPSYKIESKTKMENFCTPKKRRNVTEPRAKSVHPVIQIISTEPTFIESRERLQSQLEAKYSGQKAKLYGVSRLREKYSISSQERRLYGNEKSNSPSANANYFRESAVKPLRQVELYEDLRTNLRKASRIRETQPHFWNSKEKALQLQDFRAICIYGPKIMQQIQKVFIDNHGQLKQIDEYSMQLLESLFKNQNAIKILEIVLFSYSLEAINHIQDNRKQLINEVAYNEPSVEGNSATSERYCKPKRIKMQKQLRKKFKNSILRRPVEQQGQ